jgi:hypothetical protein
MQLWQPPCRKQSGGQCLDIVGLDQRDAPVIEQLRQGTAISTSSSRLATAEAESGRAAREARLSGRDAGNLNEAMAAVMAARRLDDGADLAGRGGVQQETDLAGPAAGISRIGRARSLPTLSASIVVRLWGSKPLRFSGSERRPRQARRRAATAGLRSFLRFCLVERQMPGGRSPGSGA